MNENTKKEVRESVGKYEKIIVWNFSFTPFL